MRWISGLPLPIKFILLSTPCGLIGYQSKHALRKVERWLNSESEDVGFLKTTTDGTTIWNKCTQPYIEEKNLVFTYFNRLHGEVHTAPVRADADAKTCCDLVLTEEYVSWQRTLETIKQLGLCNIAGLNFPIGAREMDVAIQEASRMQELCCVFVKISNDFVVHGHDACATLHSLVRMSETSVCHPREVVASIAMTLHASLRSYIQGYLNDVAENKIVLPLPADGLPRKTYEDIVVMVNSVLPIEQDLQPLCQTQSASTKGNQE